MIAYLVGGVVLVLFWSLGGQTPGMRFLSIRLMQDGSRDVTIGRAIKRLFALVVALLPLGLGYFWILRNPSRHAWHDTMTQTEIVYDAEQRAPYVGADAAIARGSSGKRAHRPRAER